MENIERTVDYGEYENQIEPLVEVDENTVSQEALAEVEYEREEREAIQSETYFPVRESHTVFLGVLPEEERRERIRKAREMFDKVLEKLKSKGVV